MAFEQLVRRHEQWTFPVRAVSGLDAHRVVDGLASAMLMVRKPSGRPPTRVHRIPSHGGHRLGRAKPTCQRSRRSRPGIELKPARIRWNDAAAAQWAGVAGCASRACDERLGMLTRIRFTTAAMQHVDKTYTRQLAAAAHFPQSHDCAALSRAGLLIA